MSGVLAAFASEAALRAALDRLRQVGVTRTETYTPVALDDAAETSPLPAIMFAAGVVGFVGFFALMTYADVVAYPVNIGGRPRFSWPAFVPIAFELGVLCAMVAGFVGYIVAGRLLNVYAPVDECDGFRAASRDRWMLALYDADPARVAAAREVLGRSDAARVEDIP